MANVRIPYLITKRFPNGRTLRYWQPSTRLRQLGWGPRRLSDDLAAAIADAQRSTEKSSHGVHEKLTSVYGRRPCPGSSVFTKRTNVSLNSKKARRVGYETFLHRSSTGQHEPNTRLSVPCNDATSRPSIGRCWRRRHRQTRFFVSSACSWRSPLTKGISTKILPSGRGCGRCLPAIRSGRRLRSKVCRRSADRGPVIARCRGSARCQPRTTARGRAASHLVAI